jgi:cytosine/adenosine deaminase-related metal-dependent hydrolase
MCSQPVRVSLGSFRDRKALASLASVRADHSGLRGEYRSVLESPPERFICAASGSNARVYNLDCGYLAAGKAADIVLIDAPDGGTQQTALAAIKHGDIAAIGAVMRAYRDLSAEAATLRPPPARLVW